MIHICILIRFSVMAGVGNDSDATDGENSPMHERPQNLLLNPMNVGLTTADNVLSPNNSRIVQRAETSETSNLALRAKNDPLEPDCSTGEMPENYFGNSNVCRSRVSGNRVASTESFGASALSERMTSSLTASQIEGQSIEGDPTTEEILQNGLGLVLYDPTLSAADEDLSGLVRSPPAHNWQSNKHSIKSRLQYLLNTGALADVTFLVGGSSLLMTASSSVIPTAQRFVAHKFVLSMSSAVFDAMFNGHMAVQDEAAIEIPDVEPVAFEALLKFLYTDDINVESETVMSVLYTAKKYAVPRLEHECVEFLKDNIQSENVFMLLTQARLFDEPVLAKMCLEAIDKNTSEALSSDGFVDIDLDTLCVVLGRDSLGIRESKLFSAVTKWAEHACIRQDLDITPENQRTVLGKAVRLIRYPLMTVEEFAVQVFTACIYVYIFPRHHILFPSVSTCQEVTFC